MAGMMAIGELLCCLVPEWWAVQVACVYPIVQPGMLLLNLWHDLGLIPYRIVSKPVFPVLSVIPSSSNKYLFNKNIFSHGPESEDFLNCVP